MKTTDDLKEEVFVLGVPGVGFPRPPEGRTRPRTDDTPVAIHSPKESEVSQSETLGVPIYSQTLRPLPSGTPDPFQQPIGPDGNPLIETDDDIAPVTKSSSTIDPVLWAIVLLASGLMLLFLVTQWLTLLSLLATLPPMLQWIGVVGTGTAMAAVLSAMGYLGVRFLLLRTTPGISLSALQQLEERAITRKLAQQETARARQRLMQFLREYPVDKRHKQTWRRLGFQEEDITLLTQHRERLLNSASGSDRQWIRDLEELVLPQLDTAADNRIRHFALQVGLKTAAAPSGFLDAAIVLVNNYLLLGELCAIYNVRTGPLSTLRLLLHVGFNLLAANRLEDLSETAMESLTSTFQEQLGGLMAGAIRHLTPRTAEGIANGLLLGRFGNVAKSLLRPVAR